MARKVHVVPHTHWDREWYDSFPTFRFRLVELLDDLLPRLDADPAFTHFQLDGQMAVIDDYLEVRPEESPRLRRLNESGRLSMGPWYVLPDEFLVSGETLIRDLQLGFRTAEGYGGAMEIGYLPDMFGHVAAMPQLLTLFGISDAVVWRGVPAKVDAPAFWWQSPDGSRVRAEYLSAGYGNGSDMPADPAELAERIDMFVGVGGDLVGEDVLWMAGMDHEAPPRHLTRVVDELNRSADAGYELTIGSLGDHLRGAPTEGLPVVEGELRSGARANLLMGVASNRVDVKIAAARAERALERLAEPLVALWASDPHRWRPLLDIAWREVIRNAAHDSICACSHDEVVDAVLHRYAEATATAVAIAERAAADVADRFAEPGVHLLNPTARERSQVVEIDVPGPFEGDPTPDPTVQVLAEKPAQEELHRTGPADAAIVVARELIFEQPQTRSVRFDDLGDLLVVHLLPTEDPGASSPADALGELGRRCAENDALTVSTVLHRVEPSRRVLTMSGTVPGFGWTRWQPVAPKQPVRATVPADPTGRQPVELSNGSLTVVVDPDDGTFALNGVAGYGRLVDGGDAGDTYNWSPPDVDVVVDRPVSVDVELSEAGPLRASATVRSEYLLPERVERLSDGTWTRVGEVVQTITTRITVQADEHYVRVSTTLDHHVRDHRLRVLLPLPHRTDHSVAECAFGLVQRPLFAEGGPNEWGVPTFPSRRFVRAGGLTLTHEGLCEYELVDLDGDAHDERTTAGALALTLVRATGWLSRGPMSSRPLPAGPENPLDGAQVQKPLTLEYAIALDGAHDPEDGRPVDSRVDGYALADRVWSPLIAVDASGGGPLAATGTSLEVRGIELDAVLRDGDSLVVRGHEPAGVDATMSVAGRCGEVVDLLGNPLGEFDGSATLRPHQILTLRLDPA